MKRAIPAVAAAVLFALAVWLHVPYANGPKYWQWQWLRRPHIAGAAAVLALAASPLFLAQRIRRKSIRLALVALSAIALELAVLTLPGDPRQRIETIIADPAATSYYTAASQVLDLERRSPGFEWVRHFDRLLRFFPSHARTKPIAPVALYVALIRDFGVSGAFGAAAILVGCLVFAAVLATYAAIRPLAGEPAAFCAATLFALMPAVALFFPQLDVIYPLVTAAVLATWPRALAGSRKAAIAFGGVLAAMVITSYSLLVLGAFCAILTLLTVVRLRAFRTQAEACGIAIATTIAAVALIAGLTGFPPLATFRAAMAQQTEILPRLHRVWPTTIVFDLLDFLLAAGWAPAIAAVLYFRRPDEHRHLAIAAIVTPPIVAVTGVLQAETARVWIFLLPLLALAAALEIVRWPERARMLVYLSMLVVTIALYTNMRFTWEKPAPRLPPRVVIRP